MLPDLQCLATHGLWTAANLPGWRAYRAALGHPEETQRRKLGHYLQRNAQTAFGKEHGLTPTTSYEAFAKQVPLAEYEAFDPWIQRIRAGEAHVLAQEPVLRLMPTSGTTRGKKLIPFTTGLQREFDAAIAPWLVDLFRSFPPLMGGPSWWSITPVLQPSDPEAGSVPIGFEQDTAYLGGTKQRLAAQVQAVPPGIAAASDLGAFRYLALLALLRRPQLRLISVWHPSFLSLLLDDLPFHWNRLLSDLADGTCRLHGGLPPELQAAMQAPSQSRRARLLHKTGPEDLEALWPSLKVISCWGNAAARLPKQSLQQRFPCVHFQDKGLIATEAFVSLPYQDRHPLALTSHFFEFVDEQGGIHLAHQLRKDGVYTVVATTAGGLWRYRLGDRIAVNGFMGRTPSVQFLGRDDSVSDYRGEKLSEPFVADVLSRLTAPQIPAFAMLAPENEGAQWRYVLYVEGPVRAQWPEELDRALRGNPNYAYCRDLGQLLPPRVFQITQNAYETFLRHAASPGTRAGDLKPSVLSRHSGWAELFRGSYLP